jgi:hypothetical protein
MELSDKRPRNQLRINVDTTRSARGQLPQAIQHGEQVADGRVRSR